MKTSQANSGFFITCIVCVFVFIIQCTPNRDKKRNAIHTELIRQANLLSVTSPEKADSLYRLIANDPPKEQSANYINAVTFLADIFISKREFDSARIFIQKAEHSISENPDTALLISILNIKGKLYYQEGIYDSAVNIYQKGLALLNKGDDNQQKTAFTINAGKSALGKGNYSDAAKLLEEGLKMAIAAKSNKHSMAALISLSVLYSDMKQYDEAIKYAKRQINLALTLADTVLYAQAMMNIGISYKNSGMIDSALLSYTKASVAFAKMHDSMSMIMTLYNKGIILKNAGKYSEAEKIMKFINKYSNENEMYDGQSYSLSALAAICEETKREKEGLMFIDTAIQLAIKHKLITRITTLYQRKHTLLAAQGRFREAYDISLKAVKISDSLSGIEVKKEIFELKAKYEAEEKEAENSLLKKNNLIIKSKLLIQELALAVTLLLVSILVLLFLSYRKKIRHHQALSEQKSLRLENENLAGAFALEHAGLLNKLKEEELNRIHIENELKSEQIDNLELKSGLKEQELVFHALARAELSQLLLKIIDKLQPFTTRLRLKKDQEEFSQMLTGISRDSDKEPLAQFELHFRQLHPDFYEKLLSSCQQLSKSELNISAMIRLNLSTKDMANLVNLSISTIDTNRYHIRRKLGLNQGDNLTAFLMKF